MPFVKAGPNEFLLVGRKGAIENRGSAIQLFLRPGTIWVLVPSMKQEAAFEFTQETKDGIPLRFKGIVIYRISDPVAAARQFPFEDGEGVARITTMLNHICLGELRHAVSHMTMAECIEQRKTTLTGVVEAAMRETTANSDAGPNAWGVEVEVAQVAQVFIVDSHLRQQLEAEVRNEIKVKSDQSDLLAAEEVKLAEMESERRVLDQKLGAEKAAFLRAQERLAAQMESERQAADQQLTADKLAFVRDQERLAAEMESERQDADRKLAAEKAAIVREQERLAAQVEADEIRIASETPVRLLQIEKANAIAREELELQRLQLQVRELAVESDLILERARHALRLEMLPLEQAPKIVDSAAKVLHGTNLSVYGDGSEVLGQLAPMFELLTRSVRHVMRPEPVAE
jgi:regulator of protease activity HflC (stomatin/prohibitin superfamily)